EQRGADGRTIPPGEDLGEDSHARRVSANDPIRASKRWPSPNEPGQGSASPVDLGARYDSEFRGPSGVEFERSDGWCRGHDALLRIGDSVGGDVDDATIRTDEDQVERQHRVLHPEAEHPRLLV